jgi:hypothetical protein
MRLRWTRFYLRKWLSKMGGPLSFVVPEEPKPKSTKANYQPVQWEEWSELEALRKEADSKIGKKP